MEKGNIISKLNIKDYSKMLEEILTKKPFSEDTKNLLLNMLYKIENAYADYKKVKVDVPMKKEIMEEALYLIEQCNEIQIVKPQNENEDLKKCSVIPEEKKIIAYPNEIAILYSLYKLEENKYEILKKYDIIKPSVEKVLNIGRAIDASEIIRDFDGWSWNINKSNIEDIFCNFIYQSINLLLDLRVLEGIDIIKVIKNDLKNINTEANIKKLLKTFFQIAIIYNIQGDTAEQERLLNILNQLKTELEIMSDKKKFLEQITENKRIIKKEIAQIEITLNDDILLKKEYISQNKVLPPEKRVFSLSDFSELQEQRKQELLNDLENNNKKQEPENYVKEKSNLEEKINFLEEINLINCEENQERIIENFITSVLKIMSNKLKRLETKKDIIDFIYKIRYYRQLLIDENTKVEDLNAIEKKINDLERDAITVACNLKVINIISLNILENYKIISSIINAGIIDLESIQIEIKKGKDSNYINIYEEKSLEQTLQYEKISDLNIKTNKIIKLFM